MNEKKLYKDIETSCVKWVNDGTQTAGVLTREIVKIVNSYLHSEEMGSVEQFREIFPSRRLPTGKNFKSNLPDLTKKLHYFVRNYNYPWEVIMEAARQYVEHAQQVNYEYIRTASYFVYKLGEGSDLADWCDRVINEESGENEPLHKVL